MGWKCSGRKPAPARAWTPGRSSLDVRLDACTALARPWGCGQPGTGRRCGSSCKPRAGFKGHERLQRLASLGIRCIRKAPTVGQSGGKVPWQLKPWPRLICPQHFQPGLPSSAGATGDKDKHDWLCRVTGCAKSRDTRKPVSSQHSEQDVSDVRKTCCARQKGVSHRVGQCDLRRFEVQLRAALWCHPTSLLVSGP